jgi:hypothetical protein
MKIEKKKKNARGSVLVLTVIAILILSIMVTGLLTVGTTENYNTMNFQLNKTAYYIAVDGGEEIRASIDYLPDPNDVEDIVRKPPYEAYANPEGVFGFYITGSLQDLEEMISEGTEVALSGSTVEEDFPPGKGPTPFEEFTPFPLMSAQLGSGQPGNIVPLAWKFEVTSKYQAGKRSTYTEIICGVLTVIGASGYD